MPTIPLSGRHDLACTFCSQLLENPLFSSLYRSAILQAPPLACRLPLSLGRFDDGARCRHQPIWKAASPMNKTLIRKIVVAMLVLAFDTGCAGMSTRQQQALSGGAIGAGAGVAIGEIAAAPLTGALIGAGAGGLTGALWEDLKKSLR